MKRALSASAWRGVLLLLGAVALVFVTTTPVSAQTGTIRGTVTDAVTGRELVGVRVILMGTTVQQRTDVDGAFTFDDVPVGQRQVQVLAVGYNSVTASTAVGSNQPSMLNFELRRLSIVLDELVVTGTAGAVRRRQIGNSVATITSADLETASVSSLDEIIRGRTAGAIVMASNGQPGMAANILLRGASSIQMSNAPLIYVDGVRLNSAFAPESDEVGSAISFALDIRPEDIERVEVVKGAAATTLYGTEASAGVIQIFTKKGTAGKPAWAFSIEQGVKTQGHIGPTAGASYIPTDAEAGDPALAQQARDYAASGLFVNDCREADPEGCPARGTFLRNGRRQRYNLSVRGGTGETNYYVSGNWSEEQGVLAPGLARDWGARGNFGFRPSETVSVQYNSSFVRRDLVFIPDGNNAEGFLLNAFRRQAGYTPLGNDALIFDMRLNQAVDHFVTGLQTSWVPSERFRQRLNVGLDWQRSEYTEEKPFGYFGNPDGARENDTYQSRNLTVDYAGTWQAPLGSSIQSSFSWGAQLYERQTRRLNAFGENFGLPGKRKDIDAAANTSAAETIVDLTSGGFFLQEMVGLSDKLFITGGVRWDGFSTFGEDFGIAAYPKLSFAYMLSENDFWPLWFDDLKLRAALGYSGRAPGTFDATRTWDAVSGDEGEPGVTPSNPGDRSLGPEKTKELEVGAEGTAFNGRVSFEYSYYDQKTSDALVAVQQVPTQGFVFSQLQNIGTIRNKGHELALNVTILPNDRFNWDVGLRYSNNKSSAEDISGQILPLRGAAAVGIREGFPVPSLFGPVQKTPDAIGAGAVDRCTVPEDRVEFDSDPDACGFLGPNFPVWSYGISTRLTIARRLTIDALGEGVGGNYISLGTARQTVRRNVWPECQGVRDRVRAGDVDGLTGETQGLCARSPAFIDWGRKADFFRLRHITLAYRLPESWLPGNFRRATVSVSGKNLFLIAPDFRGLDPEAVDGGTFNSGVGVRYSYYNMPIPRDIIFKLSVDF